MTFLEFTVDGAARTLAREGIVKVIPGLGSPAQAFVVLAISTAFALEESYDDVKTAIGAVGFFEATIDGASQYLNIDQIAMLAPADGGAGAIFTMNNGEELTASNAYADVKTAIGM